MISKLNYIWKVAFSNWEGNALLESLHLRGKGQPALRSELQNTQGYIEKPCLKNKK